MSDTFYNILLIEDDQRLADLTSKYLQSHGTVVTHIDDGADGLKTALRHEFDVVLLDIMLPSMNGLDLLRRLRKQKDTPVIMLTARGEEADRVMGLEIGADDYLPKPFSPRELLARITALVRRVRGQTGPKTKPLRIGGLRLEPTSARAFLNDKPVDLTSYEFSILAALADNAGRILSRDRLMDLSGGDGTEAFDRSIDVHISRLRKKLGDDPHHPTMIRTIRGMGYLFMDDETD